jgi:hypothetical protein
MDLKRFLNEEIGIVMRITPVCTAVPADGDTLDAIKVADASLNAYDERFDRLYEEVSKDAGRPVLRSPGYLRVAFAQSRGQKSWQCQAGHLYFAISPSGKFGICQDFDTDLDFLAEDFLERWRSEPFQREMVRTREACGGCTYPCYLQTQIDFDRWWEGLAHGVAYEIVRGKNRLFGQR